MRLLGPLLLSTSLLVTTASPALAQAPTPTDQQARTHFESGRLYFERGQYEAALREFEAAYELSHRAALLYNIVLTNERLARYGEAADRLEQYLREDTSIDAEQRETLTARVGSLRERAERAAAASTPVQAPEPVAPAGPGGLGPLGIAGIGALAAGGASLVVFAIAGGLALDEDAALADRCGENVGSTCTEDEVSSLRTLAAVADATLAIGLVLAAAGATMLAIDLSSGGEPRTERISVAPMLGPSVAGIVVGGRL